MSKIMRIVLIFYSIKNKDLEAHLLLKYRISANSFHGSYSFLDLGVRQVFKGGNYSFLKSQIGIRKNLQKAHFVNYMDLDKFRLGTFCFT